MRFEKQKKGPKKPCYIALAIFLAFPVSAFCQTVQQDLVGLGMPPEQADYLAGILPSGSVLGNNTYTKGRNAANSADINMFKINSSDDTLINSSASDDLILQLEDDASRLISFDASSDTALRMFFGDAGTTAAQVLTISGSTSDADDDATLSLAGGGAASETRGAFINIMGNEHATEAGELNLNSSSLSGADIFYKVNSSDGSHRFYNNSVATLDMQSDGDLYVRTGNVQFATAGKYVEAAVYVPTPGGTPTPAVNWVQPGLNVVPTAAAGAMFWLGPATPVPGQQFMIYNNAGAAVRIKGAGAAVINGGTAGKYIEMGVGSYMECKTLTTAIQQCPFYTVNGVVAAMPTPA